MGVGGGNGMGREWELESLRKMKSFFSFFKKKINYKKRKWDNRKYRNNITIKLESDSLN